ncbi:MAG: phosphate ABC transporter ATP-binding protein PstB [Oscillochloridaceae bacterium]|nr:phosphate ABC transporter ATP-binding protein PstB [Chloroflexaceae bacterium]MDW8391371.1 phosphate ABC transporter ATP-binding protein PstB [Oscillochloridaceae bacterium]
MPEIEVCNFDFYYGSFQALESISLTIPKHNITALIGPSGCGKSTLLRALNRMHDNTIGARGEGEIRFEGRNILTWEDLVDLRKRIGMIFQRSTAFPMSIFDNVAYGLRLESQKYSKSEIEGRVEQALRGAALWDEVKDNLKKSGLALSGGQQQRLCIARAIAVEPKVLLMDEPCAALDPISTLKVEELMLALEKSITIVIVTHNMQQAARVADYTAFMNMKPETRAGQLIEFGPTKKIFSNPDDPRTEAYISGKFG